MARGALEQYGMADADLDLIRVRRQEGKLVFKVAPPEGGEYLLKMYSPPRSKRLAVSRSEAALRSQLLWQTALTHEAGLPAPEPVPTSGDSLTARASVEDASEERLCVMTRWVPGELKEPKGLTLEDVRRIGSYAAGLHNHAEAFSPPKDFVRPRWDWKRTFGPSAQLWRRGRAVYSRGEMATFKDAAELVRRDLRELGEGNDVFGLIHRDIQAKNLVFDGDGVAAIDFESCGWGHYLFDLALITLRLQRRQPKRHAELHSELLEGYREERHLPESHEAYFETFVVMRLVERLGVILHMKDIRDRPYFADAAKRVGEFVEDRREREPGMFLRLRARRILRDLKGMLPFRRPAP